MARRGQFECKNLDVFDFSLTAEEMQRLKRFDSDDSAFFSHYDPDMVESFYRLSEVRNLRI